MLCGAGEVPETGVAADRRLAVTPLRQRTIHECLSPLSGVPGREAAAVAVPSPGPDAPLPPGPATSGKAPPKAKRRLNVTSPDFYAKPNERVEQVETLLPARTPLIGIANTSGAGSSGPSPAVAAATPTMTAPRGPQPSASTSRREGGGYTAREGHGPVGLHDEHDSSCETDDDKAGFADVYRGMDGADGLGRLTDVSGPEGSVGDTTEEASSMLVQLSEDAGPVGLPPEPAWDPARPGYMHLRDAVQYREARRRADGTAAAVRPLPSCWGPGLLGDDPVLGNVVMRQSAAVLFTLAREAALQAPPEHLKNKRLVSFPKGEVDAAVAKKAVHELSKLLRRAAAQRMRAAGMAVERERNGMYKVTNRQVLEFFPEWIPVSDKVEAAVIGAGPDPTPWDDEPAMHGQFSLRVKRQCSMSPGDVVGLYSSEGYMAHEWDEELNLVDPGSRWDDPDPTHPCPWPYTTSRRHELGRYAVDCGLDLDNLPLLGAVEGLPEQVRLMLQLAKDASNPKLMLTSARLGCEVSYVNDPRRNLNARFRGEEDFREGGANVQVATANVLGLLPLSVMVAYQHIEGGRHLMYDYGSGYWALHRDEVANCADIQKLEGLLKRKDEELQCFRWQEQALRAELQDQNESKRRLELTLQRKRAKARAAKEKVKAAEQKARDLRAKLRRLQDNARLEQGVGQQQRRRQAVEEEPAGSGDDEEEHNGGEAAAGQLPSHRQTANTPYAAPRAAPRALRTAARAAAASTHADTGGSTAPAAFAAAAEMEASAHGGTAPRLATAAGAAVEGAGLGAPAPGPHRRALQLGSPLDKCNLAQRGAQQGTAGMLDAMNVGPAHEGGPHVQEAAVRPPPQLAQVPNAATPGGGGVMPAAGGSGAAGGAGGAAAVPAAASPRTRRNLSLRHHREQRQRRSASEAAGAAPAELVASPPAAATAQAAPREGPHSPSDDDVQLVAVRQTAGATATAPIDLASSDGDE